MSVKNLLASLGRTAEAAAKAAHGKAKVVQSEGFSPLAGTEVKAEESKPKAKAKKKAKAKPKAEEEQTEEEG